MMLAMSLSRGRAFVRHYVSGSQAQARAMIWGTIMYCMIGYDSAQQQACGEHLGCCYAADISYYTCYMYAIHMLYIYHTVHAICMLFIYMPLC